jgi:hypothetical protein
VKRFREGLKDGCVAVQTIRSYPQLKKCGDHLNNYSSTHQDSCNVLFLRNAKLNRLKLKSALMQIEEAFITSS